MMPIGPATRIYLAAGATDLRKSYEGLSDQVRHRFQEDPLSGPVNDNYSSWSATIKNH